MTGSRELPAILVFLEFYEEVSIILPGILEDIIMDSSLLLSTVYSALKLYLTIFEIEGRRTGI